MKRWWGIRHIWYFYLKHQVIYWAESMAEIGLGMDVPNLSDINHLDRVWRGEV